VLKSRVDQSVKENEEQTAQFKNCATKAEIADIIKRADEDRTRNAEQYLD
jgi:hypothetical protein